jgi:hypothetical protein
MQHINPCKISFLLLAAAGCLAPAAFGQNSPKSITAKYVSQDIQLDGVLDEAVWQMAEAAGEFWQYFPNDSTPAEYQLSVKMLYNDNALLIGIRAEAPHDNYVVTSLKRDFGGATNDNITLLFDTFNDGTNAYAFGVTPYGVQREVLVSNGGATADSYNATWDIKWQAESKIYPDYYTVEMVIPFSSLKFENGGDRWGFRPYRWNLQTNEQSTWVRVPQSQLFSNLAFMGELRFEKPLGKSRTPLAFIPYLNALAQKDYSLDFADSNLKLGGDAKIAVGDGLNLDLTFNPDFSNVEVDDIFTNLTRFEMFLPEKRQFFIDNSDLLNSFGNYFNEARPFFSRRIGLARDAAGNLIQNNIIAGARLSGKLNEDWRLGFLDIQTAADELNKISSNNNLMFALQRKIGSRSNIGAFVVSKQRIGTSDFATPDQQYNRVVGMDYNLASADNAWSGKFYLHKSLQPDDSQGNYSAQGTVTYNKNNWVFISDWVYVDRDFRADLGFVPRRDILKSGHSARRYFYPANRTHINRYSASAVFVNYWRPSLNYQLTDYFFWANWDIDFTNQATLMTSLRKEFIYLTNVFDPTRSGAVPLPGNEGYHFHNLVLNYASSPTQLFTWSVQTNLGQFYNGRRYSAGGQVGYRIQPWMQGSLNLNYDGIRLPEPYGDADLWLLTPRLDITFSKSLFWTTLVQYSSQRENLGINSRLQWRFAPLSDLFLVYNDNYNSLDFSPRFRSVNLKVTYWLNL